MEFNKETAQGISTIIKTGERNKWAFSLILSVILNAYLLMRNDKLQDKLTVTLQQNTKDQRDILLLSRGLKQLNDTLNYNDYEKH